MSSVLPYLMFINVGVTILYTHHHIVPLIYCERKGFFGPDYYDATLLVPLCGRNKPQHSFDAYYIAQLCSFFFPDVY